MRAISRRSEPVRTASRFRSCVAVSDGMVICEVRSRRLACALPGSPDLAPAADFQDSRSAIAADFFISAKYWRAALLIARMACQVSVASSHSLASRNFAYAQAKAGIFISLSLVSAEQTLSTSTSFREARRRSKCDNAAHYLTGSSEVSRHRFDRFQHEHRYRKQRQRGRTRENL